MVALYIKSIPKNDSLRFVVETWLYSIKTNENTFHCTCTYVSYACIKIGIYLLWTKLWNTKHWERQGDVTKMFSVS